MTTSPKVFISYSHDSDEHKEWVYKIACKLIESGVETLLDQWGLQLGSNLMRFMETGLTNSDRVLVICTDNYNKKSNGGLGGVGYEKNILTAELFADQDTTKFIPCIKNVSEKVKTPICLGGRTYIDFSDEEKFEENFKILLHELYGIPLKPKPTIGKNPLIPSSEEVKAPSLRGESSTVFFSRRFSSAFPGVRGIQWFKKPEEAVERLCLLMREPIVFSDGQPIWWWRTGDLQIDSFKAIASDTVQLDYQELVIEEIAAVNAGDYYQQFVYIKTAPSAPSGLYDHSIIEKQVDYWGYAREEFAVFHGTPITRAEYDDNAAVIEGKVVDLNGEAELVVKYLTPYNLIIAPFDSPINNNRFDRVRLDILNGILKGECTVEDLAAAVLKLPKRERY